jgi:hypothetical protein
VPQNAREEEEGGGGGGAGGRVGKVTNCVGSGTRGGVAERNTTIILAILKKTDTVMASLSIKLQLVPTSAKRAEI